MENHAWSGGGAGIFADARPRGLRGVVAIDGNTIKANPAGDGTSGAAGAGITVFTDTATAADSSIVTITTNTVDGNVAKNATGDASLAFGGGILVATGAAGGFGTETVTIGGSGVGNAVRNNVSEGLGGGISVQVQPAPGGKHTADVDANTVSANTGRNGGGGLHLVLRAIDRVAGAAPDAILRASSNSIIGNHAQPDALHPDGVGVGGGIDAELQSDRTVAASVLFEISGNTIEHNDAGHGGGASLLASADDDPANDGAVAATEAE